MATIHYTNASRHYERSDCPAVKDLTLGVEDGEFIVLVGPSGCGKSTALRLAAGLEQLDGGEVSIGGRRMNDVAPKHRDVAMVFQNYALYPHMTVAQNLGFALKVARTPKSELEARVSEVARMLGLDDLLNRRPRHLSGGQRQRVAMGRAIVRQPKVFLMDEPLSNLDAMLRVETRAQIAALQRRIGTTTVYVTHDQVEAMTLGDRVAVMLDGELQQVDHPRSLYDRPANAFVARFIGSPPMNLVDCDVIDQRAVSGPLSFLLAGEVRDAVAKDQDSQDGTVTIGVRPESLSVVPAEEGAPLVVDTVEVLGADAYAFGSVDTPGGASLVVRVDARCSPAKGERLWVCPIDSEVHVFSRRSGWRYA